jgi:hypothetical protein
MHGFNLEIARMHKELEMEQFMRERKHRNELQADLASERPLTSWFRRVVSAFSGKQSGALLRDATAC